MCQASSGTAHVAPYVAVTTFLTASRARLRRARPGRARPDRMRGRGSDRGIRELARGETASSSPGGGRGDSPAPGGSLPRPAGQSPPGAALPPVGIPAPRKQAVPAPTRPPGPRLHEPAGPFSPRRALCRRAKITVKSARCARVLRTALRAAQDCDLPLQDPAPIRRTGGRAGVFITCSPRRARLNAPADHICPAHPVNDEPVPEVSLRFNSAGQTALLDSAGVC